MAGFEMRRRVLEEHPRGRVVMVDTIAHVAPEDAGHVVVAGSHGGVSSGEYAARVPVAAVFFNDAGGGKKDAGVASLANLEPEGIAAAAVSHDSARIGDALDAWENGVVSRVNGPAAEGGLAPGRPLRELLQRFTAKEKVR
ncbi:MAG TPA: hypothetical protein VE443_10465 [Beijerinckiaceae bacterium]|nr:hypothetical protein [Beijerinckiaceae bacterium]